ncbi:hypothetical protein EYF80_015061 [Liparis tanakae]|uniref:Uncharacterized protein n=1 Tax=Liparis tanakae TaxID=230148 RepID=A0A4Z2ICE3_9TELE|nr:hypothetical protein EYF80_015061 [Liparis tanakae]
MKSVGLVHYRKADCRGRWWRDGPGNAGREKEKEEEEVEEGEARGFMTPQPGEKASSQKPPLFSPETQKGCEEEEEKEEEEREEEEEEGKEAERGREAWRREEILSSFS